MLTTLKQPHYIYLLKDVQVEKEFGTFVLIIFRKLIRKTLKMICAFLSTYGPLLLNVNFTPVDQLQDEHTMNKRIRKKQENAFVEGRGIRAAVKLKRSSFRSVFFFKLYLLGISRILGNTDLLVKPSICSLNQFR